MSSYREHRPQDFASFIGQQHVLGALKGALSGKAQHAYLFAGPWGSGKTSLARIYARALQCQKRSALSPDELPCNACESCLAHIAGSHPDIIEIDAATYSGVDQIREKVIIPAGFHPMLAPLRVFILDEAHMLSASATAALLKLLEEPPDHVVFVLCSTDSHRIPVTLRDRCWQFTLAPGSRAELTALLERVAPWIDHGAALLLARQAGGSYRRVLAMLDSLVSEHGQEWGSDEVIRTLRMVGPRELERMYAAVAKEDIGALKEALDTINERVVDTRYLLTQLQEDCHRGLLQLYGQLDESDTDPVLVLPKRTPAGQIRAWRYLQECETTAQRDSELAVAMAVYGLLSV